MTAIRKHLERLRRRSSALVADRRRRRRGYILDHQRLRFPFVEAKPFDAEGRVHDRAGGHAGPGPDRARRPASASATSASVELHDGRALVTIDIDPKYKDLVHTDATALLRPKTGLKDMFVELDPGTDERAGAPSGLHDPGLARRCPTSTPTRSSPRSTPTRATTCSCWSTAPARACKGRGDDLARGLAPLRADAPRPRARQRRRSPQRRAQPAPRSITLAQRAQRRARRPRRRARAARRLARRRVFRAFASEEQQHLRAPCSELPGRAARRRRDTLGKVAALRRRCSARRRRAAPGGARARPGQRRGRARSRARRRRILRNEIRPFVREARPLVRDLRPPSTNLAEATPDLTRVVRRAQPPPQHARATTPTAARARTTPTATRATCSGSPGSATTAIELFSTSDANGTFRPITVARAVRDAARSCSAAELESPRR